MLSNLKGVLPLFTTSWQQRTKKEKNRLLETCQR